ncbi:MAG: LapA family protein [Nostocales cyanobacterium]|nr:MAG: LapA family protein [Nostocales cyanobacterium]TAF18908.1 MAG: LapA family protein [Nostocales cyanobacterium]
MTKIPLILLAVIVIGLIILLTQNLSPSLPLVFLGMRTQPLSLALWILFSITAGGLTSVLVSTLFKLTNIFAISTPPSSTTTSSTTSKPPRVKNTSQAENISPGRSSQTFVSEDNDVEDEDFDDWNLDNSNDDWDFAQPRQTRKSQTSSKQQTPKNLSDSDSVYSYSSQTPKNTAVGKTESVYDADYRVIIPPYQPSDTNQNQDNDDDWGFFEDDEDEDDKQDR